MKEIDDAEMMMRQNDHFLLLKEGNSPIGVLKGRGVTVLGRGRQEVVGLSRRGLKSEVFAPRANYSPSSESPTFTLETAGLM